MKAAIRAIAISAMFAALDAGADPDAPLIKATLKDNGEPLQPGGPSGLPYELTISCRGSPDCRGTYFFVVEDPQCPDRPAHSGPMTLTGVDLSRPSFFGRITLHNFWNGVYYIPGRLCSYFDYTRDWEYGYSATWDGHRGTISYPGIFRQRFTAETSPPPAVFPMTVSARIDSGTANATALIEYRPQDVGSSGSIYVFAVAPAGLVRPASSAEPKRSEGEYRWRGESAGKEPIQCVLAQLAANGQLIGVSAASLQAYATGVLNAGAVPVTILNGIPTAGVAGATFYVGYGTSAAAMMVGGINRSAVTVPGSPRCRPEPPQAGWWWNPAEDGRGFSIEVRGNQLFFASFLYDITGRSTWLVSNGGVSLDGTLYSQSLYSAAGGQTLGGAYPGFPALRNEGGLSLAFDSATTGTLVWPGGVVPIQRFNIIPGGVARGPAPATPQSGWWWNEREPGRGFFMEWQGDTLDIAGFMYDGAGNPVWYLTVGAMGSDGRSFSGSWWSYGNGQSLTGAWRPHARLDANVAPLTLQFSGPDSAIMTLPGGSTTRLQRHRF